MTFKTLDDLTDIAGKRVLVRVDLNVPVKDGVVTDATRIERVAPTIRELAEKGAKVILLAHFGSIDRLRAASSEEIAEVAGFGSRMAAELHAFLKRPENPAVNAGTLVEGESTTESGNDDAPPDHMDDPPHDPNADRPAPGLPEAH